MTSCAFFPLTRINFCYILNSEQKEMIMAGQRITVYIVAIIG